MIAGWLPSPPPPGTLGQAIPSPAWRRYLALEGYTETEAGQVLPGLAEAVRQALEDARAHALEDGAELEARGEFRAVAGAARAYLTAHQPLLVQELPHGPPSSLGPAAMGRRLQVLEAVASDGTRLAIDRVTGARWTVRLVPTADQAGMAVAAGALYRLVGVAAPAARLVELEGRRQVAWPELLAWFPWRGDLVARHARAAALELPADAWISNSRLPDGVRARMFAIPDTAALVRWDLTGCLAYRAAGRPDGAFTPGEVSELGAALELPAYQVAKASPELLGPMAARVAAVTEDQVRAALELGGLEPARLAVLSAALLARRSLIALRVLELIRAPRGGARSR